MRAVILKDDGREVTATYDNTKLSAINTCPTWGIVRYTHHKTFSTSERALALDAGKAAHDGFAAIRLYQLAYEEGHMELAQFHATRLFGSERAGRLFSVVKADRSHTTNRINMGVEAVLSSGYYDDPRDRRRTLDNISESVMFYAQQWDSARYPIWIRDESPTSDVGIEIAFSFLVEFHHGDTVETVRICGKIDGIHTDPKQNNSVVIHENKTGARIDDAWLAQWTMSHQITGYGIAASVFTDNPVWRAVVLGLQLPLPRASHEGLRIETVNRTQDMVSAWLRWVYHTHKLHQEHVDDPANAPRYTHSCNRYFRPCSFLALCTAPQEEQNQIIEEMVIEEWNPLHEEGKSIG